MTINFNFNLTSNIKSINIISTNVENSPHNDPLLPASRILLSVLLASKLSILSDQSLRLRLLSSDPAMLSDLVLKLCEPDPMRFLYCWIQL